MGIEEEWCGFFRTKKRSSLKRITSVLGIHNLVDLIDREMADDEYIVIPPEHQILPPSRIGGDEITHLRFKKGYNALGLGYHTKEESLEKKLEPQQLMIGAVEREYRRPIEVYLAGNDFITRRGFSYPTRTGRINNVIPQAEIIKGWRLFSAIACFEIQLKVYPRGDFFEAHIPSRKDFSHSDRVELFRLPTDPIGCYAQWPNLQKASTAELAIYEAESHDYEIKATRFNFMDIATYLLRGITEEVFTEEGIERLKPLLLNPFPAPTPGAAGFAKKLENNVYRAVLRGDTAGRREKIIRNLNDAEKEVFYSMRLYKQRFGGSYIHDEGFENVKERAREIFEIFKG